jgi:predicted nucleic acid-binding protein
VTVPERIVFDAEPLVAHAAGEPGSGVVEEYLNAVADGETNGYVSRVNLTELRYIIARQADITRADEYVEWLFDLGVRPLGVDDVWEAAAEVVLEYNPALGDSFALATADHLDAVVLVGADDDFDDVSASRVRRFREDPV